MGGWADEGESVIISGGASEVRGDAGHSMCIRTCIRTCISHGCMGMGMSNALAGRSTT